MKNYYIFTTGIALIACFIACTSSEPRSIENRTLEIVTEDSITIVTFYGDSEKLAKKSTISKNSTKGGYIVKYSKEGLKRSYTEVRNNVKHGAVRTYHDNGTLKKRCEYRIGKLFGKYETFYPSGTLHNEQYYHDDEQIGDWYEYRKDGTLSGYAFFNTSETCVYKMLFNKKGQDSVIEGDSPFWAASPKERYKVHERVLVQVGLGTPPNKVLEVYRMSKGDWVEIQGNPFKGIYTILTTYDTPGEKIEQLKTLLFDINDGSVEELITELPIQIDPD
ncbi:MAG: toxin-antitoxin system YwqK family antitoxin [Bacteroidia bacterium]